MEDFGSKLKAAREARGISLREIATATKISMVALDGLERNDLSKLPAGIFGRAFLRAYALEVGLDPEKVVEDYLAEVGRQERDAASRVVEPDVTAEDREFLERQRQAARILRIVATVVAIAAVVLISWRVRVWMLKSAATKQAAAELAAARTPAPLPNSGGSAAPGTIDSGVSPTPPAPASTTASASDVNAKPIEIDLSVTTDCWVRVVADGTQQFAQVLHAGERQHVSASRLVLLDVGSAGALTWSINGRAASPLGPSGSHRQVTITPANVSDYVK
jgi:cytoskeleton protein RodZ